MIQLTIHVELLPDKLNEFNQSWESFVQHKNSINGLASCEKNCIRGSSFKIVLQSVSQDQMNIFKESEWFEFLIGAIATLGDKSHSKESQVTK